jgi:hypothetical protein
MARRNKTGKAIKRSFRQPMCSQRTPTSNKTGRNKQGGIFPALLTKPEEAETSGSRAEASPVSLRHLSNQRLSFFQD